MQRTEPPKIKQPRFTMLKHVITAFGNSFAGRDLLTIKSIEKLKKFVSRVLNRKNAGE